ncbi:hypothetical protein Tco_0868311 [Tanacetum coccineum]
MSVATSPYRLAPTEMEELSNQLKELKDKGFIWSSSSPWGAPIKLSIHLLDQDRYPVSTSLIHIESCKSPTAELFEVDSGGISIRHCEY